MRKAGAWSRSRGFASPLPGGAINYVYGLTGIALVPYIWAPPAGCCRPSRCSPALGALGRIALQDAEPLARRSRDLGGEPAS